MKTAIFTGFGAASGCMRLAMRSVIIIAAMAAGALFGAPLVTTLAGGVSGSHYGYLDGQSLYALFSTPIGVAVDQGNDTVYVADYGNNAIRELGLSGGDTYTFATSPISSPVGVAVDANGNVFVLNRGGAGTVSANGTVVEFDQYGDFLGTLATQLTNAAALAIDIHDNIYVTERTNLLVKIPATAQTTVATTVATVTNANALLKGIAVLPNGNIAACDFNRDGIYTINPTYGTWSTNAGFNGPGDGTGIANKGVLNSKALFFQPYGVAAAGDGTLVVSDFGNDRVKVVTVAGITTNLYGVSSNDWISGDFPGWVDGTVVVPDEIGGVASRCPVGVALSSDGTTVYTSEDYYQLIRETTGAGPFAQFVYPPPAPAAPADLTAMVVTNGTIVEVSLTWSPVTSGNVTNYLVERSSSTNAYATIGQTSETTFADTNVVDGETYYYIVQAENGGGESADSSPASVTIPIPPPPPPTIGWFDYQGNDESGFFTMLTPFSPGTNNVFNNDISIAILPNVTAGILTYYIEGATPLSGNPITGANPPAYANDQPYEEPLPVTTIPNMTIEAVNVGPGGESQIVTSEITFQCGNPGIEGTNAAQFTLYDVTTNVTYYYTTDGTDPLTNAPSSQEITTTNGAPVTLSINISTNFIFEVVAVRGGYAPSMVQTNIFLAQNFQANELTWGFQSGEASSEFVASPGEVFYAPVTLTTLPGTVIYSMEFDMVVTNLGPHSVPTGGFGFQSMMDKPLTPTVWEPIPPFMFIGDASDPPTNEIVDYDGTNFVDLETTNFVDNELALGWFEVVGETNLYPTLSQDLIHHSQAYIDVFPPGPNNTEPNGVIVGGYSFQVPTNAQPGEQYQIQLNRPSANADGLGGDDSAVAISLPMMGSLSNGAINSIKFVTVGQPKYLAGDTYPFQWFNAGDFGNGDLITYGANDVEGVFNAAIYQLNVPPTNSDFFDAMDSSGGFGAYDAAVGYWTNANITANFAQLNALFNFNDNTNINNVAFGDGKLDVSDVYVTFLRSQFPNLYWFQRFYTNDTVHGVFGRVAQAITSQTNVDNAASSGNSSVESEVAPIQSSISITNTPLVNFAAGDYLASAGESISIPITANVFGLNPLRMLMLNVNVVPLDGSPALTTPITFTPNAPFNDSSIYNPPDSLGLQTNTVNNYAAAFLPVSFPISANAGIIGSNVVGNLTIVIPANATSMSAYAISFTHASASPNGLVSFPRTTFTGLITLSSRTNSYYNDGIPDFWRLRYFGTIYNELSVSNADADGTGMDNWQKYLAGLNPMDPTSVLNEGTDQQMAQSPQDLVLYWPSVSGQTYIIKRSSTLFPPQWTSISTNIGDGTYMEIHDTSSGKNRFYQVTTP